MAGVESWVPSRCRSKMEQLQEFVRERLSAAAEEIFGAVERTFLELEKEALGSMEAVRTGTTELLLTSAEPLPAGKDAASPDLRASGEPASTEPEQVLVKPIKDEFWDGPGFWPGPDQATLMEQWNSDSVCLKLVEEGTTHTSADPEAECLDRSDFCQPVSSEGEPEAEERAVGARKRRAQRNVTAFHCGTCGESFLRRSSMVIHAKSHATPFSPLCPSERAAPAPTVDNLCHVCGKTFTTATHLKRHMLIHTGQRPHRCKECGKTFARGECLRIHMRIHTVERPYACQRCPKSFRQRSNLVTHMRMHTGEKPYLCSICSQPFTYKKDLNKHTQSHSLSPAPL
ncbi:PREDICTED: zinc finger protein 260-like [Cyprinodon variegatus]|uniref:Zinc finger protein 260-like n=1 Tax=Cyprinodon variegatus TaxID=28743 RepID=A0A3Q2E255_CYPVA|nr:PREDICTED: zinc finger protein 260-like [Cyprinodon variegatus]